MHFHLVHVPYDSGRRGWRMGGGPLRLAPALARHLERLGHDVRTVDVELDAEFVAEIAAAFELARRIRAAVAAALDEGAFPLVLAGNCISSLGTVAALGSPAVYWFDAHGDLNTPESTRSGFLDGMAISVLLGRCWRTLSAECGLGPLEPEQVALLGGRDLEAGEKAYLRESGLHAPERDGDVLLPGQGGRDAYLHIDLDVLDPTVGSANAFAAPGGLGLEELMRAIDTIAGAHRIAAAALTAYDPDADAEGAIVEAAKGVVTRIGDVVRA